MAKTKKTYYEKLRDPRWQRKRLEIMQREHFSCERCGSDGDTLNVHHSYYEKGHDPWEYPSDSLHCLCESCHEYAGSIMQELHRTIGKLSLSDTERLLGFAKGLWLPGPDEKLNMYSDEMIEGVIMWAFATDGLFRTGGIDTSTLDDPSYITLEEATKFVEKHGGLQWTHST